MTSAGCGVRGGKAYARLGFGLLLLAASVWWLSLRDRDDVALEKVSGEAMDGRVVELVSVEYPGGVESVEVRLRTGSEDFDMEELAVTMHFFNLSPTGFEYSDARREVDWGVWDDSVSGRKQPLLRLHHQSPFDRVRVELHFEDEFLESATYDWPQG